MPTLLLLAATVGCAGSPATLTPTPNRADAHLTDAEITTIARLLQLEDRRVYDEGVFASLLEGARDEVRRRGAMAAGRAGDTAAVPLLLRLLAADPAATVRADAAFALGELGHGPAPVVTALEAAAPAGWIPDRDDEVQVVVEVIAALGKLGGPAARALVRDALEAAWPAETPRQARVAAEALLTVWKFEDGPGNVRSAAPYLESPDPRLRWRAAYGLMRGADPSALELLLPRHDDPSHRVRAYRARALASTAADSAGLAEAAVATLTRALADPHAHVRITRSPVSAATAIVLHSTR